MTHIGLHRNMFFRHAESSRNRALWQNASESFDLEGALAFAISAAKGLQDVHRRSDAHQALCLANIRLNGNGAVELRGDAGMPLGYVSPEQTGRMNRSIDYRSDYYSLGVVLYELLTGHLPFESDDSMELVHSHIAKQPLPPNQFNADLPEVVSDIVLNLLAKNAEDRYQSLEGLLADLQQCQSALAERGSIPRFPLGEKDLSDRLQISQKLYGREHEAGQLAGAFNRIAEGGAELLLVAGYSGIGKSALVHEMHKPVAARHGYFITGKFDQFKRNIPYSAINNALRELIRQILTESESRIAQWKEKLLKALGPNGQMAIDAIPELEYIIGKQPAVPQLGAARNSYNYVMQNFVGVFTRPEHPLALFLDDLQWADAASLKLISILMRELEKPCLLLIGAYRDNEVEAAHPLMLTVDEIGKEARVSIIEIKALPQASITELVADTVKTSAASAAPLAQLIYRKTLGNPFFVRQFLKSLYHERLLTFNGSGWHWDIAEIEALGITDNVVDLLTRELHRLPDATQHLLTLAACIGNRFDIKTLATVSEITEQQAGDGLQQAIQAGLIRLPDTGVASNAPTPDYWHFQHDRVQQAAYEGIPRRERKAVHLKIGRLLLSGMTAEERDERIFDIVHQLNEGSVLLTWPEEKDELAHLNLVAAKKARASAAFDMHRACAEIALEFGGADVWAAKQAFMHEVHMELITAAFVRADYAEMERLCRLVCDNSTGVEEAIAAKEMLIRCYGALYKPAELLKTGIELLALSGIKMPARLGARHIWLVRIKLKLALRGRDPLKLAELPPAVDARYLLQLQATTAFLGYGLTYLAGSNVVLWVALEMIRKSVRYGISPYCAYAYAVWARTLSGKFDRPVDGYKFGRVSAQVGASKYLLGAVGIYQGVIRHRCEPLRLSLQPLMDTYVKALEVGDRAGAVVALQFSDAIRFQSGGKVSEALAHIRKDIGIYRKMDYAALLGVMIPWALLFSDLVGESVADISQGLTMEDYVAARKRAADPWGVFYIRAIQCIADYFFGDNEAALAHAEEAMSLPGFELATPSSGYVMLIGSLAQLTLCRDRDGIALKAVARRQRRFQSWARHAPMNYLHKWQLVEAERWRVLGKADRAARYFDLAIGGARLQGFLNDEALANELAARFYLEQGRAPHARMYMEEAYAKYQEWGALAKMRHLESRYPELLSRIIERRSAESGRLQADTEQRLDLDTVIKASQTLSGEIQLDRLLKKLMLLLIENAGAQKGILLLQKDGVLIVQARAMDDAIDVLQGTHADKSADLSVAIVNYVRRTGEKVLLGDAGSDAQFSSDPYIQHMRPKSVMCIPLQKRREPAGILYLENNLTVDAFTPQHTELLQILSTQVAISLENAALYNELEQKVEARTQALRHKNEELNDTLQSLQQTQKQLVESEKLASLGQLVAGVAHEINTPVGVAVTGASTLAEETTSLASMYRDGSMKRSDLDKFIGAASTISKLLLSNMERAATLIQSFKEVAIDQTSQERRVFRLKAYIDEILLNVSPLLRKGGHEVTVDCDDTIEIDGYPGALSQVLTNFVMNALLHAFQPDRRGMISITVREVDAAHVELCFADNGKGIPAETLPKIFDPFFTTMRGRGGSGLGLNIIHNLVTGSLQGQITVESTVNAGTIFILHFPRSSAKAAINTKDN